MAGERFDLVVAANRLPVSRVEDERTGPAWQRSPGGLVSAVEPAVRGLDAAWVGWAGNAGPPPTPFREGGLWIEPVGLTQGEVERYYEGFSNQTLWPLFHSLVVPAVFHRAWWAAYRDVNARFARAIVEVAASGGTVWVHDYHLMLVPQLVRASRPDLRIGWFDHIPFPPVELLAELPWRREVLVGVLGADFLGFQQAPDADNFLRACKRLLGLTVADDAVTLTPTDEVSAGRKAGVGALPISVDFQGLDAMARSSSVMAAASEFRASLGDPDVLLLGADRLDYTKGIRHRLVAYEELLRDGAIDPSTTVLVQACMLSREGIEVYRALREDIEETARGINDRWSAGRSPAVLLSYERYSDAHRAAMFLASDVMLITPLRDGMNLVAKEYVASRHDLGGALVLSELAGAAQELREAFLCNPYDIDGTKQVIASAISVPAPERSRRMEALRRQVADHDVRWWASRNLEALACAPSRRTPRPRRTGPA